LDGGSVRLSKIFLFKVTSEATLQILVFVIALEKIILLLEDVGKKMGKF
jgi:hypothetical protein